MRSAVGGWVRNRLEKAILRPVSGLTMNACAAAGWTFIGTERTPASIFASADARALPSPISWAPERSASNSRLR